MKSAQKYLFTDHFALIHSQQLTFKDVENFLSYIISTPVGSSTPTLALPALPILLQTLTATTHSHLLLRISRVEYPPVD
jgi:hypothetical protein